MAFGHPVMRRIFAVTRILTDVVGPNRACAAKSRFEHGSVARHAKSVERLSRCARQRVKLIFLARFVCDIVEKSAELRARQFSSDIGYRLDDAFLVKIAGEHLGNL